VTNTKILSTQPYKGTKDLPPEEFGVQKYIFDTWRKVCKNFGYEEYQTPLLEPAELYRAKSGEDIGGKELFTLTDMAQRELALRPELTPSVTRMVAQRYKEWPKPIKLFSIGNFYRNERPQRGRNREFWQLNADIFGEKSDIADIEILTLAIELMLAFNPPKDSFKVFINSRNIVNNALDAATIPNELKTPTLRTLDKWNKIGEKACINQLQGLSLNKEQLTGLVNFMNSSIVNPSGELEKIMETLKQLGYLDWIQFEPSLVRGLDYYDGMVFEVFDTNPKNNRALFGGGRYNGLASLFGRDNFPAVGFAPGNETMRLFLETWDLIPKFKTQTKYLVTVWPDNNPKYQLAGLKMAQKLRTAGQNCEVWLNTNTKLDKQLKYADKKSIPFVLILGAQELTDGTVTIKDMATGKQDTVTTEQFVDAL
jgi:histidyl-tRNA synthetase